MTLLLCFQLDCPLLFALLVLVSENRLENKNRQFGSIVCFYDAAAAGWFGYKMTNGVHFHSNNTIQDIEVGGSRSERPKGKVLPHSMHLLHYNGIC